MSKPIRIVLIDDHQILRAGLRLVIENEPDMGVVGEAGNRTDALRLVHQESPDVVLLDLNLGGTSSLDWLQELLVIAADAKVLVVTGVTDPDQYRAAVRCGARGLVFKEKAIEVLIEAIRKVHSGELWIEPTIMADVLEDLIHSPKPKPSLKEEKVARLTAREREIVDLVCEGLKNKQIGDRLSISEATVRNHLTSILDKLGLSDRLELAVYFYRHGLANPPPPSD